MFDGVRMKIIDEHMKWPQSNNITLLQTLHTFFDYQKTSIRNTHFDVGSICTVFCQSFRFVMLLTKKDRSTFHLNAQHITGNEIAITKKKSSIAWWTNRVFDRRAKKSNIIGHHIKVICSIFDVITSINLLGNSWGRVRQTFIAIAFVCVFVKLAACTQIKCTVCVLWFVELKRSKAFFFLESFYGG